jgi:hypothetical protein
VRLKLTLLGGFQAQLDAGAALVLPTRKTQALLAYLALPLGQAHPREKLATLLWGDMPDAQARGNLRHALSRIRTALPKPARPGFELLRAALDELRETGFVPYQTGLLGTLAQGLAGIGLIAKGLATIDEALARSERDEEHWCIAELVRIKAELVLLAGGPGAAAAAEELFQQALQWTRRQGILSMELRCATGLARLWHQQGRPGPARELLAPVYGRFTEGFDTPELQAAKTLLARLG